MRSLIHSFSLISLVTIAAITAQAEPGILWVKVLNLKNTPVPKVSVGTEGPGSSTRTDDRGLARIRLAPQTRPGTWVTLEVSSGNYAFVSPWNRKVLIPPFENESENFVTVYLTTRGDREALESGRFAVAMAAKFNATLRVDHPNIAAVLENYAGLLRKMNRETEAVEMESRAKEIRAKAGKK